MHYACLLGYTDCVKILSSAKTANLELGDKDQSTPIQAAASLGSTGNLSFFLKQKKYILYFEKQ